MNAAETSLIFSHEKAPEKVSPVLGKLLLILIFNSYGWGEVFWSSQHMERQGTWGLTMIIDQGVNLGYYIL